MSGITVRDTGRSRDYVNKRVTLCGNLSCFCMGCVVGADSLFLACCCAGGICYNDPFPPIVTESGNDFLFCKNFAADGALYTVGKTGFGAG